MHPRLFLGRLLTQPEKDKEASYIFQTLLPYYALVLQIIHPKTAQEQKGSSHRSRRRVATQET